jgi:hypothetical protein
MATLASRRTSGSYNISAENGVAETMLEHPCITLAPEVLAGKPVIRGTRLPVEFVIGLMARCTAMIIIFSAQARTLRSTVSRSAEWGLWDLPLCSGDTVSYKI